MFYFTEQAHYTRMAKYKKDANAKIIQEMLKFVY
jgi:hypothetical protein